MTKPLAGRVALVTGGASGIGAATAALLAERGAAVAITDIAFPGKSTFLQIKADNRNVADIRTAVGRVEKELGKLDILVNNAGTSGRSLPIEQVEEREFDDLVAPGLTETPLTRRTVGEAELKRRAAFYPLGRLPTMEEPAYAVAWLASEEASMVTAQTISPNGGIAVVGY